MEGKHNQEELIEVVIPKDKAVFGMNELGKWYNEFGLITKPSIIKKLNSSLSFDECGFYVSQVIDTRREKIYFPYVETALFAIDFSINDVNNIRLKLNTKEQIQLDPESLFVKDDCLYQEQSEYCIKFSERALVKLSKNLEEEGDQLLIVINGHPYSIEQR